MKKVLSHIAILGVLAGLAFSCGQKLKDETKEGAKKEAVAVEEATAADDMKAEESPQMVTPVMSEDYLADYQNRAIQKLQDFVSYLEIISDKQIDAFLREQTLQEALGFFDEKSRPAAEKVLNLIYKNESLFPGIKVTVYEISEPFTGIDDETFTGSISYSANLRINSDGTFKKQPTNYKISIILKKIEKDFGDQKEEVWEVFLGEIIVNE